MAQHGSLCWQNDQLSWPCSFCPITELAGGHEQPLPPPSLTAVSTFQFWGVEGLSYLFPSPLRALLCSPLFCIHNVCWYLSKGKKVGACRMWPDCGQLAQGGCSSGSSWSGSCCTVTQSWMYHGHSLLCSTAQLCTSPCQAAASTGFNWDMLGYVVSFFGCSLEVWVSRRRAADP